MELKADPDLRPAALLLRLNWIAGASRSDGINQEGTLREGDPLFPKQNPAAWRAMINDQGRRIKEAGPSMPVEVIGFSSVPQNRRGIFLRRR